MIIDDDEIDRMFEKAGIVFDDLHGYFKQKYELDNVKFEREDVQKVIDCIKEWKNGNRI